VHGWLSLANVFARIAGPLGGVSVRIAAEGGAVTTRNRRRARRDALLDRLLGPVTDAYVANSQAVADSLRERGVRAEKIVVIPNGVAVAAPLSPEERASLRRELGAGADDELVGMVARLDADFKDHETLLAAAARLLREGRPLRVAIVGDGAARRGLERRAEGLGIAQDVVFTGYRPDTVPILGALDVSVLLTRSEGFSNVILESMAASAPLVASRIPPNGEALTDGVHGLLVPLGDVAATAAAVRRLLEDRLFAAQLAEAARRRAVDCYSLELQATRTMELYERLLASKAGTL
jgi:glycosyltransferase involved in cell wall biosynthesis